jgi:hypothetical protein
VRILEALLQKADENVRDHQLHIIEFEIALKKEKHKVNIKEESGASGATKSPYFRIMRKKLSDAAASETDRRSASGRKSTSRLVDANGEMMQMNESEKIREYFQNTESRVSGGR